MATTNNINKLTRKNQIVLASMIALGLAGAGATIYYANSLNKQESEQVNFEEEEKELEPDLTGAVGSTFDGQVSAQIVTDAQTATKEQREALDQVLEKLNGMEMLLEEQKKENEELRKRIEDSEKTQLEIISSVSSLQGNNVQPDFSPNEGYEGGNGVVANRSQMKSTTSRNQVNSQVRDGYVQLESPKAVKGSFERKVYSKKGNSSGSKFYVPSGAFSNAIILEGADANAAVTAQQNDVTPMQFKLTGKLHLPANQKNSKLTGCFVTAGTYGDISSERAIVRLNRLSCVINGKHIDQPVKGHVAFYGKNGIKGEPVMRNGKILGLAFASGALGGIGSAVSAVGDTQAGLGATRTIGGNEVLREALGGGTTTAANKLADYYIQRAEQYHPVIPIGSANRVEVVFTEGFWAEFIEDKQEDGEPQTNANVAQAEQVNPVNGDNWKPKELENQLGDIEKQQLSDFVTPNQPK